MTPVKRAVTLAITLAAVLTCAAPPAHAQISVLQALVGNNYSGCTGTTTCAFAFGSNVTMATGELLYVSADNGTATTTIASTGAGCSSTSWTSLSGTANLPVVNAGALYMYVWWGRASGSGACTVTTTADGVTNTGQIHGEFSGTYTGGSPIDTQGSSSSVATAMTITAGGATAVAGEYGIVTWGSNNDSAPITATGWTELQNYDFDGVLAQSGIGSGVTTSFVGTGFAGAPFIVGVLATLRPAPSSTCVPTLTLLGVGRC